MRKRTGARCVGIALANRRVEPRFRLAQARPVKPKKTRTQLARGELIANLRKPEQASLLRCRQFNSCVLFTVSMWVRQSDCRADRLADVVITEHPLAR